MVFQRVLSKPAEWITSFSCWWLNIDSIDYTAHRHRASLESRANGEAPLTVVEERTPAVACLPQNHHIMSSLQITVNAPASLSAEKQLNHEQHSAAADDAQFLADRRQWMDQIRDQVHTLEGFCNKRQTKLLYGKNKSLACPHRSSAGSSMPSSWM